MINAPTLQARPTLYVPANARFIMRACGKVCHLLGSSRHVINIMAEETQEAKLPARVNLATRPSYGMFAAVVSSDLDDGGWGGLGSRNQLSEKPWVCMCLDRQCACQHRCGVKGPQGGGLEIYAPRECSAEVGAKVADDIVKE